MEEDNPFKKKKPLDFLTDNRPVFTPMPPPVAAATFAVGIGYWLYKKNKKLIDEI